MNAKYDCFEGERTVFYWNALSGLVSKWWDGVGDGLMNWSLICINEGVALVC